MRDTDLKLRAVTADGRISNTKEYRFYKSLLHDATVTLDKEPSAPYVNGGAAALVDFLHWAATATFGPNGLGLTAKTSPELSTWDVYAR